MSNGDHLAKYEIDRFRRRGVQVREVRLRVEPAGVHVGGTSPLDSSGRLHLVLIMHLSRTSSKCRLRLVYSLPK